MIVTQYRLKPGLRHTGYIGKKRVFYKGGDIVPLSLGGVKAFGDKFDTIKIDTNYDEPKPIEVKTDEQPTSSNNEGTDESIDENGDDETGTDEVSKDNSDNDTTEETEQETEAEVEIELESINKNRGRWIVQTTDGQKQHKKYISKKRAEEWVRIGTDPGV